MMGRDLARALDPVQLALDCGLTMDPWQARLLQERPRRDCDGLAGPLAGPL